MYSENNSKPKNRGGLALACVLLMMILCVAAAVGVFILLSQNINEDVSDGGEVRSETEENYQKQIEELQKTVDELKSSVENLKNTQSEPSSSVYMGISTLSETGIEEISETVKPSIVTITVSVPSTRYQSGFFYYTVGGVTSTGSGIIYNTEGYIITNYHVVSYYDSYENVTIDVTLSDGREFPAEFIGGDKNNDLAIIKIESDDTLVPAKFGKSSDLKVGAVVLAIGNPLGIEFAGSVTLGIVSAVDRTIDKENTADSMIQTDAAINPGNSGGALVNTNGEVVGITTLKVSDTEVEGLGFAIPIDYASPIISNLVEFGYVKDRPATGISGSTVSASISRYYGVPQGVIVTNVEENSGADLAGIQVNDIITEIDGEHVETMADIQAANASHKVGDIIKVTAYRNGEYYSTNLKLMEDRGR
ncbi:MAG: trypsin-like peptidase domain-containing protein [Clostridia bacterium]|nr:trypsin-like peptidase domain-containing protein [Clostridia bacterium]